MSKDNQRISENIVKEDYSSAQSSSDNLLARLKNLVEIFIPLQERLKNLIVKEQEIQNGVILLKKEKTPLSDYSQGLAVSLFEKQKVNRDKTVKTALIIKKQIEALEKKKDQKGKKTDTDIENLLIEVEFLVSSAAVFENGAVQSIQKNDFIEAERKIIDSIGELEKALQKLQKEGKKTPPNKSSDQQKKRKKRQKQKEKEKGDNTKIEKKRGEKKQKMSPEDALRKLNKIQKRDRDELKKREKRFGKLKILGQVPVEKDW